MSKSFFSTFDGVSAKDLESLLKDLRLYRACKKVSRGRARDLFDRKKTDSKRSRIEYFGTLKDQKKELLALFSSHFVSIQESDVNFVENKSLAGGVRMFHGDDMIELSVKDFEQRLINNV